MLEFPGGLVVRTQCFHCRGPCSVSGLGAEILHQATAHCGPPPKFFFNLKNKNKKNEKS